MDTIGLLQCDTSPVTSRNPSAHAEAMSSLYHIDFGHTSDLVAGAMAGAMNDEHEANLLGNESRLTCSNTGTNGNNRACDGESGSVAAEELYRTLCHIQAQSRETDATMQALERDIAARQHDIAVQEQHTHEEEMQQKQLSNALTSHRTLLEELRIRYDGVLGAVADTTECVHSAEDELLALYDSLPSVSAEHKEEAVGVPTAEVVASATTTLVKLLHNLHEKVSAARRTLRTSSEMSDSVDTSTASSSLSNSPRDNECRSLCKELGSSITDHLPANSPECRSDGAPDYDSTDTEKSRPACVQSRRKRIHFDVDGMERVVYVTAINSNRTTQPPRARRDAAHDRNSARHYSSMPTLSLSPMTTAVVQPGCKTTSTAAVADAAALHAECETVSPAAFTHDGGTPVEDCNKCMAQSTCTHDALSESFSSTPLTRLGRASREKQAGSRRTTWSFSVAGCDGGDECTARKK